MLLSVPAVHLFCCGSQTQLGLGSVFQRVFPSGAHFPLEYQLLLAVQVEGGQRGKFCSVSLKTN